MIDIEKVYAMLDCVEGAAYDEEYGVIAITAHDITNYFNSNLDHIGCRTHGDTIKEVYMLDRTAEQDLEYFTKGDEDDE